MRVVVSLLLVVMTSNAVAQSHPPRRMHPRGATLAAENAVKAAAEELERVKEMYERDVQVLAHLRAAQAALEDAMQPSVALEKAWDHVDKAKGLLASHPGAVAQRTRDVHRELETARRSPSSADFDRLRGLLGRANLSAAHVAATNALALEEQILAWIKVQQMISDHLRRMSEIAGDSLRAAQ